MKNVEDDPAMTPGSVVRSPLSLAAIKDTDMLGGKTSPPGAEGRTLSSSTWSYAPPATSAGALKPPADAWGAKPRPAPPGLNKAWPQHHANSQQRAVPSWQTSTWLLLKNLTAQVIKTNAFYVHGDPQQGKVAKDLRGPMLRKEETLFFFLC